MPDRLPIQDAKELAHKRGLRQVVLLAWDGERTHVVTYGKSIEDCDQAAQGGEKMKKLMGWPNWEAEPSRVKRLRALNSEMLAALNKIATLENGSLGAYGKFEDARRIARAAIAKAGG
jgi:hypothetical protein